STMENDLKNEVIKVHDRIMPRTEELLASKKALLQVVSSLDSLKQSRPATDTAAIRAQADSLVRALNAADEAMSDWMYAFKTDYSGMEHEEIMIYLNEEKNKITAVEHAYEESITGARRLLNHINQE
ncbi:MAG TPA: hypothetical protein VD772_08055, partial [Anseongella sp.]|nr:hypothetical protein [Anseongella sp.]